MIKQILINLLFKLLDPEIRVGEINQKRIDEWLAREWQDMGFHEYFRKRDLTLLKTMGTGVDDYNYKLLLGKRLELIALLHKTQSAYNKKVEDQKRKIKKVELNKKVKK